MTSPDSNTDATHSKYHIQIGKSEGMAIGDNAQIIQYFSGPPSEPQVDLIAAEATYRQQVVDTYKWLNFSGFDQPDLSLTNVLLEDVFVRLALTVEKVIRELVPPGESNLAYQREHQQRKRVITVQEPIELGQALSNHLLIVGEPGAGKSTLLRWLAVIFAQGCQRESSRLGPSADIDRLPALVELGRLPERYLKPESGEIPSWIQFLPEYLSAQQAFTSTPPQLLTRALADGRCLLLFDGLDEVADRQVRARLTRSLVELARFSYGNRVIIGSRPAGVSVSEGALRPQFQRCQIERFTSEDVRRFFRFWYALDRSLAPEQQRDSADALYARVQATPAILQLASTPLLSAVLVLIWRNEGDLPERRVDLYERCCRDLIEQWEVHHDTYQGVLANMDWKDYLHLLTPLAYFIHNEEQRTSATREELVPRLAQALQVEGRYNEQAAAIQAAKQFLDTLGLRSGLLQYLGDDRYGFPHLTFQEYLAARYIAAQPDPEYIDLVMVHLHDAWWQEVHLLTIGHLGSGKTGANKASALILTILKVYRPPSKIWRSSGNCWVRLYGPARFLPQVQLARRIAWLLAREFELVAKGSMECKLDGITAQARTAISMQAASLVRQITSDWYPYQEQEALLAIAIQLSQPQSNEVVVSTLLQDLLNPKWASSFDENIQWHAVNILSQMSVSSEVALNALLQALRNSPESKVRGLILVGMRQVSMGNEAMVSALLQDLHNENPEVQRVVAAILERVGVGNKELVSTLLQDLHNEDPSMRKQASAILGLVGVGSEAVVSALLQALHDEDPDVRKQTVMSLGLVGVGSEAVVSALLQALHDEDPDVRKQTVMSLGLVGVSNEAVVSALLQDLHNEKPGIRKQAAAILERVGVSNEAVVSALLQDLHNEKPGIRKQAAAILERVGVSNEAVVSALLQALHDENPDIRRQAAESLGQVSVGNEAVVSALLQALHDEDQYVQEQTAKSLGLVGVSNEAVVSALLQALHDEDSRVRKRAAAILGQVSVGNEAVVSALLQALHDEDQYVQEQTAKSLGLVGVGSEAVVSALLQALHDEDQYVQEQAAESLGQVSVSNETIVSALLQALHSRMSVWKAAAASLGSLGIKNSTQLYQVLVALNCHMHDFEAGWRPIILRSIRQLLNGRSVPSYRWVPLRKQRARRLRLKRIAFWLGTTAVIVLIGLAATWLLAALDPNSFLVRFLVVLAGIIAFVAAVVQIIDRTLRDPWEPS